MLDFEGLQTLVERLAASQRFAAQVQAVAILTSSASSLTTEAAVKRVQQIEDKLGM